MMVLASRDAQEAAEPEPPRRSVAAAPAKRQRAQPEPEVEPVPVARKVVAAPPPAPTSPTIREFACRFEQDHIDVYLKPQTAEHYRFALARYIIPELGDRQLDDISTADVQRLHNSLRTTPSAANYMRAVLSALFGKAIAWEVTTRRNPVTVVQKFDEKASRSSIMLPWANPG